MRAGVIDIGSSSIKLMIAEKDEDNIRILESLKNVIPLGRSTFFREQISQQTINQTISLLEKYKNILKEYSVANVTVIATTAVREARNRDVFIDTVSRKTGLKIEVLNVGDVVYYIDAYLYHRLRNTYPIHTKNLIIAELGAGSLDVSIMRKGFTIMNIGLLIGSLRIKELMSRLDGSMDENYEAVKEHIINEFAYLKRTIPKIQIDDLILIDENYIYLQNILPIKDPESKFFQFGQKESDEILNQLAHRSVEDIAHSYKIPLEIADTITAYAIILNMLFTLTENKYIYILEASLSEAILGNNLFAIELAAKYNKQNQLISVANFLCNKYDMDTTHIKHVASLSEKLFQGLKEYLGLEDKDLLYLQLAAYLHDLGIFINNRSHHKHTEYIISSLSLFRLTDDEIKIIAAVARYHRKAPPVRSHLNYGSLPTDKQILVQKLSALLKIANSLDRSHKQKIKEIEVNFTKSQDILLTVHSAENLLLEKADFLDKKILLEEITGNKINLVIKN